MAEPTVRSRSPLAEVVTAGRQGYIIGDAGVHVREIAGVAAISIAVRKGRSAEVIAILSQHVGAAVEDAAKRFAGNGLAICGVAPGQWLALARASSAGSPIEAVRASLAGLAAVTDQGDGRLMLEVSGPRARDALAKGIPIDLDPAAFKVGDVAHTSASLVGLQIALVDPAPTFEIVSARSTAGSLWSWLFASAAEYGIEVA